VGVQRSELRSRSTGTCVRTSTGGGVISRGAFVPFGPRPVRNQGGGRLLEVAGSTGAGGWGTERNEDGGSTGAQLTARENLLIEFPF